MNNQERLPVFTSKEIYDEEIYNIAEKMVCIGEEITQKEKELERLSLVLEEEYGLSIEDILKEK